MEEIKYERKIGRTLEEDYYMESAWERWTTEDNYD